MAEMKKIVQAYQLLCQEWNRKPQDLNKCGQILDNLKLALTEMSFLPMGGSSASKQELLLARDVLEIGAQWAIAKEDIPAFERYIAQLKCYYFDYQDDLPESTYKFQLLGLNLLRFLSQNRLSEFHTEVELLDAKDVQSNIYIKHPISLEQYLMEGSYNKVFLARGNVPAESYNFFMNSLLDTIRNEIAACAERAYDKLGFNEAARMLFFDSSKAMKIYASQRGWEITPDNVFNFRHKNRNDVEPIASKQLAQQNIEYARELEMII